MRCFDWICLAEVYLSARLVFGLVMDVFTNAISLSVDSHRNVRCLFESSIIKFAFTIRTDHSKVLKRGIEGGSTYGAGEIMLLDEWNDCMTWNM